MFRLFRGFVAEGLGLGGLLWAMTLLSGSDTRPTIEANSSAWNVRQSRHSPVVVSVQKPPIFASLEPPTFDPYAVEAPAFEAATSKATMVEAERSTFFRGTDSLLERTR